MFYKFLISLMLCAIISLFFISKPDGQKLLNPATIQQDVVQVIAQLNTQLSNFDIAALIDIDSLIDMETLIDNDTFADINSNDKAAVTLYRWQDKQGQWHFSNDINKAQDTYKATAETIIITANSSLATPHKQTAALSPTTSPTTSPTPTPTPTTTTTTAPSNNQAAQKSVTNSMPTLPLTNALDTLQNAKNIQTLMDNHGQQLDNAIKNIGK